MKDMKLRTWKPAVAKILMAFILVMSVAIITPAIADAASKPALNKTTSTLFEGKQYDLNIKNKIKKSTYTWSTSDKKVAKVNKKGLVTAVSKGSATITCKVKAPKKTYKLTCKVKVVKAAKLIKINNKVSALTVGQEYDLNRTLIPSISNDKTTWTTSDVAIASPDKNGKFTALKEGTVTITATTTSGATDSVTIKVVDKDGTVSNQNDLNALLGSGAAKITLKTTDAASFVIASGDYSKQTLVVDAPNADVTNNGKFASVEIKAIKSSTWYENAVGNLLKFYAANARVIVGDNASASIEVDQEGATLTIVNNGEVKKVTVLKKADVIFLGDSTESVPVSVEVPNVTITTSVPLALECNAKIDLVINKGAEATKVQVANESDIPTVKGNVTLTVTVGTGSSAVTKTVTGTTDGSSTSGGSTGGNTTPATTLTFDTAISNVTSVTVNTASNSYTLNGTVLSLAKSLLTANSAAAWSVITDLDYTVAGQKVKVTGTAGSLTKTVSVVGGQFDGKSFDVTVNNAYTSVVVTYNGVSVTLTKSSDDKSFTLATAYTISAAESEAESNSSALENAYNKVTSVAVQYNGKTYTADIPAISTLKKFYTQRAAYLLAWPTITNEEFTVDNQKFVVTGAANSNTKTITFEGGQLAGKVFTVSYDIAKETATVTYSNVTALISKSADTVNVTLN